MLSIKDIKNEIIIEKSVFITHLFRIKSVDQANEYIKEIKTKYSDANHNCYAYILNEQVMKASDDGEPSKTAGQPMLDSLKKNNLEQVLAITTRYFGGIKLGAGGLIRAYSKSVSKAIESTVIIKEIQINLFEFETDYALANKVDKLLNKDFILKQKDYEINVKYSYLIKDEQITNFERELNTISNGKIIPKFITKSPFEVKND